MIVRVKQENVIPKTQPTSSSNLCMVLRGGAIPASLQTFPGMEHDRGIFNGLSQDTTSNGISQIIESSNLFDDEREIEAAAAASEAQMKSSLAASSIVTNPSAPPVAPAVIPCVTPLIIPNQTLSPLHISIGESPKCSETTSMMSNGSKESEISNRGVQAQRKTFQLPSFPTGKDCTPQRPSTSAANAAAPIIMGPPTNSSAPVLLSPAGNLHNGYHRVSSGDSAPSSPSFMARPLPKGSSFVHPLSMQRSLPPQSRLANSSLSTSGPSGNRLTSSTNSPQNGRKDHEMTRRRALVDRIAKSRGSEYVHLLPQVEGLTTTQTSILLRKHRGSLQANGLPYSMQVLIDCGAEPDKTAEQFVKKIKEANHKRVRNNDFEDLTDLSDLEEDFECYDPQERKKEKDAPRWAPKRMRYSGMLSRAEVLLAEKIALMGMLKNQKTVMDASCGVRFEGEQYTRRRRQLNGMYYLYEKSPFQRKSSMEYGCARAMPIFSWTKRKPHKEVFEDSKDDQSKATNNAVIKPTANPNEKWVATAQYNIFSYFTNGEIREVPEYDYEEYKAGEGLQQVNEISSFDPVDFIAPPDFTPLEERQMEYMYRLSTAPSCTIRKKHGRAIYFETDDRKNVSERNNDLKKKPDKKKERKRVDDASSDDETWTSCKTPAKKRARGRPAAVGPGRKKTSRASVTAKPENGIYMDYLFDDHMHEEFNAANLPPPATYANIHVPDWYKVPGDFLEDVEELSSEECLDDLLITVAQQHHQLMHAERIRVKKETEKRNRNRQSAFKSAAATPSQNQSTEMKDDLPAFDMHQFDPQYDPTRRRFSSIVKPFVPRDFSCNNPPVSDE